MSTSAELAAHPMCQLARVLTWGALGLLTYGVVNWVAAQPLFALHHIDVKTPMAHVTEAQIRLIAERRVRGTFFTVDLERVRSSLEKLPWVREARVERRWPDTLVVSLVEHVPLARWNDTALVSEAGEVFVAALNQPLPRFFGPAESSAEMVAAYRSYQATLTPLGMTIDELRLSPRRAWRIRLNNGLQIALGREQSNFRLTRFVAFYPRLFENPAVAKTTVAKTTAESSVTEIPVETALTAHPVTVDLRYPDGFAIRMPLGVPPFKSSTT